MVEIRFTIEGNNKDRRGNPTPKLKKTRGQQWTPEAKNYVAWKLYVQTALVEELSRRSAPAAREAARNIALLGKPLCLGDRKARMDIKIMWGSGNHGDPENIFGSIADALFYNDKHLAGSFDFDYSKERRGSVDILLTISEQRTWQKQPTRRTSKRATPRLIKTAR